MSISEETSLITKAKPKKINPNESSVAGVSIRGWLAFLIVGTICALELATCYACLKKGIEYVPNNQLYGIAIMIVTFYYAKKTEPPPNTSSSTVTTSETIKP